LRFLIFLCVFLIIFIIGVYAYSYYKDKKIREEIRKIVHNGVTFTPNEFFEFKKTKGFGSRSSILNDYNIPGVYVLKNISKDMYYVGQGKKVLSRVNNHFSGRGNGDVYGDYKYGDRFKINVVTLRNSGYPTLNSLERNTIMTYRAYSKGYNRTRGNKG